MTKYRMVRQFSGKISTSESRAYRVETVELLTEQEATQLMRDLGSPYEGKKYDDSPFTSTGFPPTPLRKNKVG